MAVAFATLPSTLPPVPSNEEAARMCRRAAELAQTSSTSESFMVKRTSPAHSPAILAEMYTPESLVRLAELAEGKRWSNLRFHLHPSEYKPRRKHNLDGLLMRIHREAMTERLRA